MSLLDTVDSMYPDKFKKDKKSTKYKTAFDIQLEKERKQEKYLQEKDSQKEVVENIFSSIPRQKAFFPGVM